MNDNPTLKVGTYAPQMNRTSELFNSGASLLNTATSAYSSYQSSLIQSSMLKMQAAQQDIQARQERIKGVQQSNILREQLLENLSAANALFSARGVDVGSRSALAIAARNSTVARKDIEAAKNNAEMRAIGAETQASTLRSSAKSVKSSGANRVVQQLSGETSTKAISSLLSGFGGNK